MKLSVKPVGSGTYAVVADESAGDVFEGSFEGSFNQDVPVEQFPNADDALPLPRKNWQGRVSFQVRKFYASPDAALYAVPDVLDLLDGSFHARFDNLAGSVYLPNCGCSSADYSLDGEAVLFTFSLSCQRPTRTIQV